MPLILPLPLAVLLDLHSEADGVPRHPPAVDAALHYSRRSATLFVAAVAGAGLADRLPGMLHAAISPDAAEPLRAGGARRIAIAAEPSESALLRVFADAASLAFGARCRAAR